MEWVEGWLVPLLDTQAVAVAIGAVVALVTTAIADRRRSRREETRARRDLHREVLDGMYAYREAVHHFREEREHHRENRGKPGRLETAHAEFHEAGVAFGRLKYLAIAFGSRPVAEMLDEYGERAGRYAFEGYPPVEEKLTAEGHIDPPGVSREALADEAFSVVLAMMRHDARVDGRSPVIGWWHRTGQHLGR